MSPLVPEVSLIEEVERVPLTVRDEFPGFIKELRKLRIDVRKAKIASGRKKGLKFDDDWIRIRTLSKLLEGEPKNEFYHYHLIERIREFFGRDRVAVYWECMKELDKHRKGQWEFIKLQVARIMKSNGKKKTKGRTKEATGVVKRRRKTLHRRRST